MPMPTWSLFNFGKKSTTLALVFDIGSASIGASFVLLSKEGPPKLLCAVREEMKISNNVDIRRFSKLIKETLRSVIKEVQGDGARFFKNDSYKNLKPDEIYFVFSSPWHASSLQNIHFSKRNSFIVTHSIINNLVDKEIEEVRLAKNEIYAQKTKSSVTLIEKKIILNFGGVPNHSQQGFVTYYLLVRIEQDTPLKVLKKPFQELRNIFYAGRMIGDYDMIMYLNARSPEELNSSIELFKEGIEKHIIHYDLLVQDKVHFWRQYSDGIYDVLKSRFSR